MGEEGRQPKSMLSGASKLSGLKDLPLVPRIITAFRGGRANLSIVGGGHSPIRRRAIWYIICTFSYWHQKTSPPDGVF